MVTRKVGAAIAAGNTVVCKPASETPLCAIALAKLFEQAGGPPGVFNVVTSSPQSTPEVGEELCHNKLVKHLSFTGSTPVGRYLSTECAKSIKKTSLELGGNAPFIVFEDANIDDAVKGKFKKSQHVTLRPLLILLLNISPMVDLISLSLIYTGLIACKFRSSGQTCVCANRVLVHSSIMERFAEALAAGIQGTFIYGSVWDKKVNFGPLYSEKGISKVEDHLQDALRKGGRIYYGGKDKDETKGPNFFPPTIVIGGKSDMKFFTNETFGPISFLMPFETEKQAINLANDSDLGLAAYFYTQDISRVWRVSEDLKVGMVGARAGLVSAAEGPFGGVHESGLGREGGIAALEEYLDIKSITLGI
jgi:NAD-dependent aldehyde dehydrogenases